MNEIKKYVANEKQLFRKVILAKIVNFSKEEFVEFMGKRLSLATNLEEILKKLIELTNNLPQLKKEIEKNLTDEKGPNQSLAHAKWREDFAKEIGVNFVEKRNEISDDFYTLLGEVIFIEATVPVEFHELKKLRDEFFPNLSSNGKIYFDDHIVHDANEHFPNLLTAIKMHEKDIDATKLCNAIRIAANKRASFYA